MRIASLETCPSLNKRTLINLKPANILPPEKGRLLISEPFLGDSYFNRTVILLCEHDENGSFGFILNKYVELTLPDLLDGLPNIENRISLGGPVQNTNLYYIHTLGSLIEESQDVGNGLYMGGDFEQVQSLLLAGVIKANQIRFFVGYSGWGEQQLESELISESWYVCEVADIQIMDTARDDMWSQALRQMGGDFANLAHFPSDPTLN